MSMLTPGDGVPRREVSRGYAFDEERRSGHCLLLQVSALIMTALKDSML